MAEYAHSSRLAIRAHRRSRCSPDFHHGLLVAAGLTTLGIVSLLLLAQPAAAQGVAGAGSGAMNVSGTGGAIQGAIQGAVAAEIAADVVRGMDGRIQQAMLALERWRIDSGSLTALDNLRLPPFESQANSGSERTYQEATKALNDGRYERAVALFDEVARQGTARSDAALYWKASALNKQGQRAEALGVLADFVRKYTESPWLKEVKALELEIRQASGQKVSPESQVDDDLKLMAINALMNSDSESAVPMLEKMLQGSHTPKLKERALFVLSQSNSARARDVLARVARGTANPDLQMKALNYLGIHGSKENRALLGEIYASSTDVAVKRAILRSFMIAGERERLLTAARTEQSPELRTEAVRQLGVMGAHEELSQLYQKETSIDVKKQILQAMFVGGHASKLIELAKTESDPELRRRAVRNLGLIDRDKTGAALLAIYQAEKDLAIRKEVVHGLFIQNNDTALVDLARKETDPAMKKEIVSRLSHMNTKVSLAYMMEILNK